MPPHRKIGNAGRRIYLAGPPFAQEYRRRAAALLRAAGLEPVDPMRRDFRGHTARHEGTAIETWYAHPLDNPVIAYTVRKPAHPWAVYVSLEVHSDLDKANQ